MHDALMTNPDMYQVIDLIPASIYWKNKEGRYLGCNKYVIKMAGAQKREEIIGKTDAELPWKASAKRLKEIDNFVIKNGHYQVEETPLIDGKEHVFFTTKEAFLDANKIPQGVIGVSIDITDRKKNEELEKNKAILDETIRLLQLMGGAIAHELRTPLATISLASQAIQSVLPTLFETYHLAVDHKLAKPITNEARFNLIETAFTDINKEIDQSNEFINNTLNSIKALSLDRDSLDTLSIQNVINLALERFAFKDNQERNLVHVDIKKDFKFKGIAVFMPHIFFNLLKNAIYYIHEAGKGEIFITSEFKGGMNILYFKDTGPGMDEEIAKSLFNKKFVSKRTGGTGIGLAFCRQILLQCGGDIMCQSKKGEYTKITMKFPVIEKINS